MKKIFGCIALLIIATVAALNVNFSSKSNNLSDISLANVEALAGDENAIDERSRCSVSWSAKVAGQEVVLSCEADCPKGQRAECKQNNCKCVAG